MDKQSFLEAITKTGVDIKNIKTRFVYNKRYKQNELWIYPKRNPKRQKMNIKGRYLVYEDGTPVMEYTSGLLLTKETIQDLDYLKEYLYEYRKKNN